MNDVTLYSPVPFEKLHKFLEADENNMANCPNCGKKSLKLRNFGIARFDCSQRCTKEDIVSNMDPFGLLFEKIETCTFSEIVKKIKKTG